MMGCGLAIQEASLSVPKNKEEIDAIRRRIRAELESLSKWQYMAVAFFVLGLVMSAQFSSWWMPGSFRHFFLGPVGFVFALFFFRCPWPVRVILAGLVGVAIFAEAAPRATLWAPVVYYGVVGLVAGPVAGVWDLMAGQYRKLEGLQPVKEESLELFGGLSGSPTAIRYVSAVRELHRPLVLDEWRELVRLWRSEVSKSAVRATGECRGG